MRIPLLAITSMLALGVVCVTPAAAQVRANGKYSALGDQFYNDPDDNARHHGLNFGDLEVSMPTDPYLWSADPGWEPHHTPARYLADATEQLRTAVPVGTPAVRAAAILHQAGARCGAPSGTQLQCHYNWVESPHGGEDWDNISWQVNVSLDIGQVSDLAVSRDWNRRRGS